MDYEKKYKEALERAMKFLNKELFAENSECAIKHIFPELAESEDERIREYLIRYIDNTMKSSELKNKLLAWLEKQGNEPNWCHHQIGVTKVDLSGCSEEYRKAYYDGWNSCNQQHSQCKSEWNDVVKCLINGMKFYYEDNEEATWGTEKFSMKVKDILSWLEKQGGQNPQRMISAEAKEAMYGKPAYAWNEEDEEMLRSIMATCELAEQERDSSPAKHLLQMQLNWLKSLKLKATWKPSDEQMEALFVLLPTVCNGNPAFSLYNDLKKLKGE